MSRFLFKLKIFLKKAYKSLIVFTILFFSLTWKLPFSVYSPGNLINASNNLSSSDNSKGSFNLTFVKALEGTIPTYLLSKILPNYDIVYDEDVKYDQETIIDSQKRDVINLYESVSNAIYVAYTSSNKELNIIDQEVYIIYKDNIACSDVKVGDRILSVDGVVINSLEQLNNIIKTKNINDEISIDVSNSGKFYTRKAKLVDINGEGKIGVALSLVNNYNDAITYDYRRNESGPSGGLMIALAIYNNLVNEDITKGLTISGTGTISLDGTVGDIGGVKYKLAGAVKKKADVFIVPTGDNYKEAKALVKKHNYKIKLIEAKDFKQVLDEISKLEAK